MWPCIRPQILLLAKSNALLDLQRVWKRTKTRQAWGTTGSNSMTFRYPCPLQDRTDLKNCAFQQTLCEKFSEQKDLRLDSFLGSSFAGHRCWCSKTMAKECSSYKGADIYPTMQMRVKTQRGNTGWRGLPVVWMKCPQRWTRHVHQGHCAHWVFPLCDTHTKVTPTDIHGRSVLAGVCKLNGCDQMRSPVSTQVCPLRHPCSLPESQWVSLKAQ